VVQEIIHQHHHHKAILVVVEELLVPLAVAVVVPVDLVVITEHLMEVDMVVLASKFPQYSMIQHQE
jgi:hypothetical protein